MKGELTAIVGPMYAGKTTEFINRVKRDQLNNISIKVVKPSIDNRYGVYEIKTHEPINVQEKRQFVQAELIDCENPKINMKKAQSLFIDEFQFLDRDKTIKIVKDLLSNGKNITVAGLDTDFRGEYFPTSEAILGLATTIIMKQARCQHPQSPSCLIPATRTQRIINGIPASYFDPVILIGEKEAYEARCENHHYVLNVPADRIHLVERSLSSLALLNY